MEVKLGYFKAYDLKEENEKTLIEIKKQNKITYDDTDLCDNMQKFVEFASVELSMNSLKCGAKYRNTLNGLLFKKTKPHYVGKIKIAIRISEEKATSKDLYKLNLTKYCDFYLPQVHYVIPDELPQYWLEMVEKQKVRYSLLGKNNFD